MSLKIGRNDPCYCNSGKKYKKCCMNKKGFDSLVEGLEEFFKDYNPIDLSKAIFAIASWGPNISASVKIHLMYKVMLCINEEEFCSNKEIKDYKELNEFFQLLNRRLPQFATLEDYWPEQDFGEIRFYHDKKLWKVFYGGGFENSYEYLYMYQLLFVPLNQEFLDSFGRSPTEELSSILYIQDYIISQLKSNNKRFENENLPPSGYLECPDLEYYENINELWGSIDLEYMLDKNVINSFCCDFGDVPKHELKESVFVNNFFETIKFPLFIKFTGKLLPIFTRDYAVYIFNEWGKIYREFKEKRRDINTKMICDINVSQFIKNRFLDDVFSLVSPMKEGKPLSIIYTVAYISHNELQLVYTLDPMSTDLQVDIENLKQEILETEEVINSGELQFLLNGENQVVSLTVNKSILNLKARIIILIPSLSTESVFFSIPNDFKVDVFFIREYIAIIDEIENLNELSKFFVFLEEMQNKAFHSSKLDLFGAFKDTSSVLIEGANDFNMVMLDTNWGSRYRYESLLTFWNLFPEIPYFNNPRYWKITKENKSIRLESKKDKDVTFYKKIGETHFFVGSHLNMSYDQARLSFFLTECLEYNIGSFSKELAVLQFFKQQNLLIGRVYPSSLVKGNDRYSHVSHLLPKEKLWEMECYYTSLDFFGFRIVFEDHLVQENFKGQLDRTLENRLLIDFLSSIDQVKSDELFQAVSKNIKMSSINKPGFILNELTFDYEISDIKSVLLPDSEHFKKVRNRIAFLCKEELLQPGLYNMQQGISILNMICRLIISDLRLELSRFESKQLLRFLINQSDASIHQNNVSREMISNSLQMDVDFDRGEKIKENENDFIRYHKCIRYLIESSLLVENSGFLKIDSKTYKYLLALVDWLFVVYAASDSIHYQVNVDCTIEITGDYLVNVNYDEKTNANMKEYQTYLANQILDQKDEKVEAIDNIQSYLDTIDIAFLEDMQFSFKNMCLVLNVLSTWPTQKNGFYRQELLTEVFNSCVENIDDITVKEVKNILEFLELDKEMILKTIAANDSPSFRSNDNIPVWEYAKRPWRYSIKPLVIKDNYIYWGVASVDKAKKIWMRGISTFHLPYSLPGRAIENILKQQEKNFQDKMVDKTYEITKCFIPKVLKEAELYKIDRSQRHPKNLGDYDVLAFWEEKNVIFNIECKYIRDSYCMKDAKRDLDKIFYGNADKGKSYISKLLNRQSYLKDHYLDICRSQNVEFNNSSPQVKIIPIFLTKKSTFWTQFPPIETEIVFLGLNDLSQYLSSFTR
ncbi:YecA family protein [Paenibacillus chitinolyticus]|uniref:YecA family protein n=1 Tax=Paenibacillus chitinolyticus TaxID=79263 RepID=UPI00362F1C19